MGFVENSGLRSGIFKRFFKVEFVEKYGLKALNFLLTRSKYWTMQHFYKKNLHLYEFYFTKSNISLRISSNRVDHGRWSVIFILCWWPNWEKRAQWSRLLASINRCHLSASRWKKKKRFLALIMYKNIFSLYMYYVDKYGPDHPQTNHTFRKLT